MLNVKKKSAGFATTDGLTLEPNYQQVVVQKRLISDRR